MHKVISLLTALALVAILIVGCSQAAPAPTSAPAPTKAADAAKAPEPTKAVAAQPTAAPAKKVDYPTKGKVINFINPSAAGSGSDVGARLLLPIIEKDLGVTIEVINRVGAGNQVGLAEIAAAKPDGYTIGVTPLPTTIAIYLDAKRQATFDGKSFVPIVNHAFDPGAMAVKADSPYKSLKDLIDAAKAKPEQIKMGVTGIRTREHLDVMSVEKLAGVKFASVFHDSSSLALTALLGGHLDAVQGSVGDFTAQIKSGEIRLLGVMGANESKFAPGTPTFKSLGYDLVSGVTRGYCAPAGTPKEIVNVLAASFEKAIKSEDATKKIEEQGIEVLFMGPDEFAKYWSQTEERIKPLMK